MQPSRAPARSFHWPLVTLRVLLVTFLLALLSFAVCLFLGIMGLLLIAAVRGVHPDMTIAYRQVAFPAALVAAAIALAASIAIEARDRDKPA